MVCTSYSRWMHRQVNEYISTGCVRGRSISGSDWHIQREVLGESHDIFSGYIDSTVEALPVFRTEDIRGNRIVAGCCSSTSYGHLVDNFLLPILLIHQFERAERESDYFLK